MDTKLGRFGFVGLPMTATLDFKVSISHPFEELQGSNIEFMLITLKPITRTYSNTNLSRFGLAGVPMEAILDF